MYSFKGRRLRDETKTAARETKYSTTYGRVPFEAPETLPVGDLLLGARGGIFLWNIYYMHTSEASVFKVGIRRRIHKELLG